MKECLIVPLFICVYESWNHFMESFFFLCDFFFWPGCLDQLAVFFVMFLLVFVEVCLNYFFLDWTNFKLLIFIWPARVYFFFIINQFVFWFVICYWMSLLFFCFFLKTSTKLFLLSADNYFCFKIFLIKSAGFRYVIICVSTCVFNCFKVIFMLEVYIHCWIVKSFLYLFVPILTKRKTYL